MTRPKEKVFKVYLLQEESIKNIYQSRLIKILESTERKEDVNVEWQSIKQAVGKTAYETLGKKNKIVVEVCSKLDRIRNSDIRNELNSSAPGEAGRGSVVG